MTTVLALLLVSTSCRGLAFKKGEVTNFGCKDDCAYVTNYSSFSERTVQKNMIRPSPASPTLLIPKTLQGNKCRARIFKLLANPETPAYLAWLESFPWSRFQGSLKGENSGSGSQKRQPM
jgi:hypothetical protein